MKVLLAASVLFGVALSSLEEQRHRLYTDNAAATTGTDQPACPTGAYCKNDGNEWYSQCVAVEQDPPFSGNPDTPVTTDNPNVVTRTLTTIFDVPGPTSTEHVSTFITYVTSQAPPPVVTVTQIVTIIPDDPAR